jgi:hypothetical protein
MAAPTRLDDDGATYDADDTRFLDAIRQHGWFDTHVIADEEGAGFSYTTGFTLTLGRPEVLVHALPHQSGHDILWDLFRDWRAEAPPRLGEPVRGVFGNHRACFFRVAKRHYEEYLGWSLWFYRGDGFECLQLVWPDRDDRFPWEAGFDATMRDDQPDLTERGWARELASHGR